MNPVVAVFTYHLNFVIVLSLVCNEYKVRQRNIFLEISFANKLEWDQALRLKGKETLSCYMIGATIYANPRFGIVKIG